MVVALFRGCTVSKVNNREMHVAEDWDCTPYKWVCVTIKAFGF